MMKYAPMGDPLEIRLRGYELTLRKDDAARIELVGVHDTDTGPRANAAIGTTEHPALGEGTYSPRAAKTAVPEGAPLHFALAGNQNCGKTTLFNQLTGSNQHVGNFPGVTVDRKDGAIRNHPEASVTDLPGIYSLSPYTGEEIVSRQFILGRKPRCHHRYHRRHQYRTQPVPDAAAYGARSPHGYRAQHDGRGDGQRRRRGRQSARESAGRAGRSH